MQGVRQRSTQWRVQTHGTAYRANSEPGIQRPERCVRVGFHSRNAARGTPEKKKNYFVELINPLVEQYAAAHTSPEDDLLLQINRETYASHAHATMLSGHVQGRALAMFSRMLCPKYVLEIGTFTGYSALCLAEGLQEDGELHTIELREEDTALSQNNFDKSIYKNKIHLHNGNALEIIPALQYNWDLVFIDADKVNYINYYEAVLPQLSESGLIIADNVLFHGQVLDNMLNKKNPAAIRAFNDHVAKDERVEQVLLTVRDGLLLIKKKKNA
ncbi:MAG: O-methyltransferase [Arachidicoccus sp.]|nr:O-methyltransferase [Arachidicoccus sp.]